MSVFKTSDYYYCFNYPSNRSFPARCKSNKVKFKPFIYSSPFSYQKDRPFRFDSFKSFDYPRTYPLEFGGGYDLTIRGLSTLPLPRKANVANEKTDEKKFLGSLVLGSNDVIAGVSSIGRNLFSHHNKFYGRENPKVMDALGLTSAFTLLSGGLNVCQGIEEVKTAHKISDVAGERLGSLKIASNSAYAAGGATFIPIRIFSLISLSNSSKILAAVSGLLGKMGSSLFYVGGIFSGVSLALRFYEQHMFKRELNAILEDPSLPQESRFTKALDHLKKLAMILPEEKTQIEEELQKDPEYGKLTSEEQANLLAEKEQCILLKKEAYLKRVLNPDCIDLIRTKESAEAKSVIEAVQQKNPAKMVRTAIAVTLVSVTLLVTALSFVFTGPLATILIAVAGLATAVGWLILDGSDLIQEFKGHEPGRFDKLWILLSSILALVSVGLVFLLAAGTPAILVATLVGAVWLTINAIAYYDLHRLEKKQIAGIDPLPN